MKRAVFGPPVPGDSRWQIPFGGLHLTVAAAAWRHDQWLVVRGTRTVGKHRPALPSATLSYGEPPERAARRLLRQFGLRAGKPVLIHIQSRKARRGSWDLVFVFAVPVVGRTQPGGNLPEADFLASTDPAVASAFRTAGIERATVERLTGLQRRRERRAVAAPEPAP